MPVCWYCCCGCCCAVVVVVVAAQRRRRSFVVGRLGGTTSPQCPGLTGGVLHGKGALAEPWATLCCVLRQHDAWCNARCNVGLRCKPLESVSAAARPPQPQSATISVQKRSSRTTSIVLLCCFVVQCMERSAANSSITLRRTQNTTTSCYDDTSLHD